jgi:ABC-type phosphate/phosphonate transport system substrate-binding protein
LEKLSVYSANNSTIAELKADFELKFDDFELFWYSKPINQLREAGLIVT